MKVMRGFRYSLATRLPPTGQHLQRKDRLANDQSTFHELDVERRPVTASYFHHLCWPQGIVMESDRSYAVLSQLVEYLESPSSRHIRNPYHLQKLAKEIVKTVDRTGYV
jgi:hypothetical protein